MAIVPPKAVQLSNCLLAETFLAIKIISKVEFFSAEWPRLYINFGGDKNSEFLDVLSCTINKCRAACRADVTHPSVANVMTHDRGLEPFSSAASLSLCSSALFFFFYKDITEFDRKTTQHYNN